MSVDLYKQQSTMLHEWMRTSDNKENTAIKFSILSDKDGHKEMGYVTQKIAKTLKSTDLLDVQLVDDYIHDHQSISDPDLCIVYDGLPHNYISLDGYPPWHIRLTEIINGSYYHTLNYALFSQYLYRYSKVEQRFGH
ncbi:hypothetical protein BDB01DRAFT_725898 [Pilobolus umbonatus]|nr:hypothetical protein BDB01DRAFT_725898 [Pilobolus umbonatus]